ncbi:hypothetical protein [Geoalkalibacter halelectricus]|uniref:Uncharacterized protein n=1 Tax=Geoalkalibacter halelectricus TaxID=2847045 RepID=A0ABY5ZKY2_9BACT|nr:hypothetical protein [Geoalkalibacter halelectricus]MDO3378898.1 hypothetical protein [Geoalkalibacter halelectricus]UWZ79800.1 hypothetical protein L9S41_00020 [Geoalkalibacter halelectricus]
MKIRNLLMLALAALLLLLVAGCGGSSSNPAAVDEDPQGIALVLNEEYEVFAGDMLVPEDEDTRIAVRHVFADDKRYVTLLAGSATLVSGGEWQR